MMHKKDKYVDHVLVRYTPRQAIKDIVGFVARFFKLANLKHGFRSVIGGFREYFVFFFALLLVQLMFWFPVLALESRTATLKKEAYASANYHIKIEGFSTNEWTSYYNDTFIITDTYDIEDRMYESYEYSTYVNGSGRTMYELKILMNSDERAHSRQFLLMYPAVGQNVAVEYSPRVTYLEESAQIRSIFIPIVIVLGLLSSLILLVLYNIRINHYKFRYGVYMSFGAGFEKLFHTAAWELFAIAILTFIPSFLIAFVARVIMSASMGGAIGFNAFSLVWEFIWLFIVILLAVFPSVKFLATRTPTSLIIAGDNSNYVSSPRLSFRIFQKNFPRHYELFGFWRFRKYYATLLLSVVAFSSLYLCGAFINSMVNASENIVLPDITLRTTFTEGMDDLLIDEIAGLEGVARVEWENSIDATAINSYLLLNKSQRSGIASKTVKTDDGKYADNNFKYNRLDDILYSQVVREGGWKIEGDLERVMNEDNCIAVSEYVNNSKLLNFNVGDKITIAIFSQADGPISYDVPDNKHILNQLLSKAVFDYVEVEIAAIVDTGDTDDRYMIAMNEQLFGAIIKKDIAAKELKIFAEDGLSYEKLDVVYEKVRSAISTFDGVEQINNRSSMANNISKKSQIGPVVSVCAVILLLVSPPVWFFSQSMFGAKRKIENDMLAAFGATESELNSLYVFSGVALTVPAIVTTLVFGFAFTELIYSFVNQFLTSLGMGADFRYSYEFSLISVLMCMVISAVSAIVSTYIPYLKWKNERAYLAKKHLGE